MERGGAKNFSPPNNWRGDLFRLLQVMNREHPLRGRYETDEEYRTRLRYELETSKKILAQKLDKEIRFLCWPGGVKSPEAQEIAQNAGYLSSNVTKDMKRNKTHFENRYGDDPGRISRIGPGIGWDGVEGRGSRVTYKNGFFLMLGIERVRQNKGLAFMLKCILSGVSLGYTWSYRLRDFFKTGKTTQ